MTGPLLSVIVPVFRVEPYLRGCLDSITGQTCRDLEMILVDDGSPDGCGAICDEYARRDGRVKVIHQQNGGVSAARNAGLAAASGEWVGFVDGDDRIEPDMYRYLLELASAHGADLVQCATYFEEGTRVSVRAGFDGPPLAAGGIAALDGALWTKLTNSCCDKLFRRSLLEGLAFDEDCAMGEDLLFGVQALLRAEQLVLGGQPKYHYVQREDGTCLSAPTRQRLESYRSAVKRLRESCAAFPEAARHFWREDLSNDLDICSKCVCFRPEGCGELLRAARREIGADLGRALRDRRFSAKEKLKFLLIAAAWPLYAAGLPIFKRIMERSTSWIKHRKARS